MGIAGLLSALDPRVRERRAELADAQGLPRFRSAKPGAVPSDSVDRPRISRAGKLPGTVPLVGYFCNYAPRELIAASGAIPLRLADGGTYDTKSRGERFVRSDACPFCKSCLDLFARDPLYRSVSAVVAASMCDQMRRLPEVISQQFGVPVLQMALPRTRADESTRELFRHEVRWLRAELEQLTGRTVQAEGLRATMAEEREKRRLLNSINEMRRAPVPRVREQDILRLVMAANLLPAQEFIATVTREMVVPDEVPARTRGDVPRRLMLLGSIVAEHDLELIQMIEERAAIVTDLLCTGVRSFIDRPAEPESSDLDRLLNQLADFYFDQPGCIHQRPNDGFYALARKLGADLRVHAVVLKTLLYCDGYNFEANRLERELGLPFLHIDTDYGEGNREQMRTRVEAFLETL